MAIEKQELGPGVLPASDAYKEELARHNEGRSWYLAFSQDFGRFSQKVGIFGPRIQRGTLKPEIVDGLRKEFLAYERRAVDEGNGFAHEAYDDVRHVREALIGYGVPLPPPPPRPKGAPAVKPDKPKQGAYSGLNAVWTELIEQPFPKSKAKIDEMLKSLGGKERTKSFVDFAESYAEKLEVKDHKTRRDAAMAFALRQYAAAKIEGRMSELERLRYVQPVKGRIGQLELDGHDDIASELSDVALEI